MATTYVHVPSVSTCLDRDTVLPRRLLLPLPSLLFDPFFVLFFFFNDTATTEIYTLSLHDALPICLALISRQSNRYQYKPSLYHE